MSLHIVEQKGNDHATVHAGTDFDKRSDVPQAATTRGLARGRSACSRRWSRHRPARCPASPRQAPVGQGFNLNKSDLNFILKQIRIAENHARSDRSVNLCNGLLGAGSGHPDPEQPGRRRPAVRPAHRRRHLQQPAVRRQRRRGPVEVRCGRPVLPAPRAGAVQVAAELPARHDRSGSHRSRASPDQQPDRRPDGEQPGRRRRGRTDDPRDHAVRHVASFPTWPPTSACPRRTTRGSRCSASSSTTASTWSTRAAAPLRCRWHRRRPAVRPGRRRTASWCHPGHQPHGPRPGSVGTSTTSEATNQTTPFVDQSQTYTSHPSHQVFLREYDAERGRDAGRRPAGCSTAVPATAWPPGPTSRTQARERARHRARRPGRPQHPAARHRPLRPLPPAARTASRSSCIPADRRRRSRATRRRHPGARSPAARPGPATPSSTTSPTTRSRSGDHDRSTPTPSRR